MEIRHVQLMCCLYFTAAGWEECTGISSDSSWGILWELKVQVPVPALLLPFPLETYTCTCTSRHGQSCAQDVHVHAQRWNTHAHTCRMKTKFQRQHSCTHNYWWHAPMAVSPAFCFFNVARNNVAEVCARHVSPYMRSVYISTCVWGSIEGWMCVHVYGCASTVIRLLHVPNFLLLQSPRILQDGYIVWQ